MTMDAFSLKNKNAVIVGGAGDLGIAILEGILEAGASAVCIDNDSRGKKKIQLLIDQGHNVKFIETDITNEDNVDNSLIDARDFLNNSINILVNSAGIQRRAPSEDFTIEDWNDVIAVNLTSAFNYCKKIGKYMIEDGYGKIVNIASMQSFLGGVTIPAYAASKGGIAQLTKALSNDWASKGIRVNAIAPGYMDTQLNTKLVNDPLRNKEILSRIPIGRWGDPSDLKGCAIFLCSEASDYLTGAIIPVDGGFLSR